MNNEQEKEAEKVIEHLKKHQISHRKDIAKITNKEWHNEKFVAMLEDLVDYGLIRETKKDVYKITPKGGKFNSFPELEENESLQIKLAKSNIEANELQKRNAKRNAIAMWINLSVGIINLVIITLQLLKVV